MASINFATREINCKIVYYGPGLSGKTTNLQVIHQKLPQDKRSDMVSLATEQDRTLFFDFLPLDLGSIKGFKTKFQLYTVPGQVYYNSTRKLVLRGVDGVVFVADSQKNRMAENLESLQNLSQNLKEYGFDLEQIPYVLQYNKRDMPDVFTLEELNSRLNPNGVEHFEAIAHVGKGVVATLKSVSKKVIDKFNKRQSSIGSPTTGVPNTASPASTTSSTTSSNNATKPAPKPEAQEEGKLNLQAPKDLDLKPPTSSGQTQDELKLDPPPAQLDLKSPTSTASSSNNPFAPKKPTQSGPKSDKSSQSVNSTDAEDKEPENDEVELRPYIPKGKK